MKYILFFFLLFTIVTFPQTGNQENNTQSDTLVNKDTLTRRSDIDTIIYANSRDSIIFFVNDRKMGIYGKGELDYKTTELKSGQIIVDFNVNELEAIGVDDDSIPNRKEDTPVLTEKGETYEGNRIRYNFKTLQGFISDAQTSEEGAIYSGEKIKKVDKETFFISDGLYTTCDIDTPHYHFYASEMKVIHKEQIISKWIWLHFGGVPFPVPIPFAVFPIESGRRSGILPPAFGESGTYGRYFSRMGYFWAINDYMDINLESDIYTRGSYNLSSRFRYAKRYNYTGQLEGGYTRRISGERSDPDRTETKDWRISWYHNQTIDPTLRFDASLQFMSGQNYNALNSINLNEVLRRDITSSATIFKSWEESGNSLSASYQRNQNLDNGTINEVLPSVTFNKSQEFPFRDENSGSNRKWYELIGYNYSGQFQNQRNKAQGHLNIRGGFLHSIGINFTPKLGYFNVTPNFSYQEKWYNKRIVFERTVNPVTGNDTVVANDKHEINMVRTFSTGVTTSTKFYGIFNPNALGISSIRHTVQPSISYNYQPDFSKKFWGYYDEYYDLNGNRIEYDPFQREIFGGSSNNESQSISFNIGNNFEMKTIVNPNDTTSKQEKIQLMNVDAGISYNFAADSLKFSPLSLRFRTQVGTYLNLNGGTTFSLYDWAPGKREINRFLVDAGKGLARLTSFNLSLSTSFSGESLKAKDVKLPIDETSRPEDEFQLGNAGNRIYRGIYEETEPNFDIPWDITLNYSYSLLKPTPVETIKSSNLSSSVNVNLTKNWKLSVSGSYDFDRKQVAAPQIRISRDLHCWIMNFTWNPIGTYRGYFLEIRVKAPQLQDLKLTKRDSFYSGK